MSNYSYEYPRPALTADLIVLRWSRGELCVLMIERDRDPFRGMLALPGGFIDANEAPRDAATREVLEETGVTVTPESLIEIGVFGDAGRDPRGWTVSVTFVALLTDEQEAQAGDDAASVAWIPWSSLCQQQHELAFDHQKMINRAQIRLTETSLLSPRLLQILGSRFRYRHARHLYRQISGKEIAPRAFKGWLRKHEALERVGRALYRARDTLKRPW